MIIVVKISISDDVGVMFSNSLLDRVDIVPYLPFIVLDHHVDHLHKIGHT